MCTPYIESQKKWLPWQLPSGAGYRQYLKSVGRPLKPHSISNCLVAIVLTKPVIATLVPKLVAMATSLSISGLQSKLIPWVHSSPKPKRHLDRSVVFAQTTAECPYTLQWDAPFPPQNCPSHGGMWSPHLIHGFLSPPES